MHAINTPAKRSSRYTEAMRRAWPGMLEPCREAGTGSEAFTFALLIRDVNYSPTFRPLLPQGRDAEPGVAYLSTWQRAV